MDGVDRTAAQVVPNKRYVESPSVATGSGLDLAQTQAVDEQSSRHVEGELEVDLAELSLGQRLMATNDHHVSGSDSEGDDVVPLHGKSKSDNKKKAQAFDVGVVPANSLTRTLIQALHSSDTRLLETCLSHSDTALIRNTVKRLPPQLAVPLITACADRLSRGAGNIRGGGGGVSAQRGMGLITWLKTVLALHAGHLLTVPDLVARLANVHATLTARLAIHESLLSLNGRLDMILTQIEMRASAAPASVAPHKGKASADSQGKPVTRYVEGESEMSSNDEVEAEGGDDNGSIEDIELGGQGDSDDRDSVESDDSHGEDLEDGDGDSNDSPTMDGFIDDEAEESSDEESD